MPNKKKNIINRKQYGKIKKMDHQQMSDYLEEVCMRSYEKGKRSAEGLSESEVKRVILGVKGIGEKKANDIITALTNAQAEKEC